MEAYEPITTPDTFVPGDYGLLTAVNWITPVNSHWQVGVAYDADCTEVTTTIDPCIISGTPSVPEKPITWDHDIRGSRPFTIMAKADCSPVGDWWTTGQTKVLKSLSDNTQIQLERTLWSGAAFPNVVGGDVGPVLIFPNLTAPGPIRDGSGRILLQPAANLVAGGPYDVVEGLGKLEQTLANCYAGNGVIHVPAELINALCAQHLVYNRGPNLYTWAGNQIVIGRGYSTSIVPSGAAITGQAWMMATSPIFGIRGVPRTFDPVSSLDRTIDTVEFIAEQTFVLGWACCRAGVLVTTGGEPAGLPNTST